MKVLCDVLAGRPGSWHLRPELVEPSSLSDAAWLAEKQVTSGWFNSAWIFGPSIAWQAPGRACKMWEGGQSAFSFPQFFSLPLSSPPFPRELVRNPSVMDQDGVQCFSAEPHRPPASGSLEMLASYPHLRALSRLTYWVSVGEAWNFHCLPIPPGDSYMHSSWEALVEVKGT